jgi:hypothetical protein
LGVTLTLLLLRGQRKPAIAVGHGLVGATGLCLLLLALRGPRHGDAMGVGSFGAAAAVLFGIGLLIGLLVLVSRKRAPRIAGVLIATHAVLAITAFVLMLAWVTAG